MDHVGGLPMYIATRGLYQDVEQLFEIHRRMDHSELRHTLVGLDVGEKFCLRKDLFELSKPTIIYFELCYAFLTGFIPDTLQGYVIYSVKQKLKQEQLGLPGDEIKKLKSPDTGYIY
ncbi:tRNase Z TRZ1 [Citrus sinensis]|uniref:TRNase Z TRZ1 n=1 Tax=Citrus sinensis TaxID=2711 RepID=A0ACB8NR48_CITSI|nr:tRNase Z TRZ1 [Citrus sinensis]KAH9800351.1 tRNase Z TRZ1 [Citrus sinensis]